MVGFVGLVFAAGELFAARVVFAASPTFLMGAARAEGFASPFVRDFLSVVAGILGVESRGFEADGVVLLANGVAVADEVFVAEGGFAVRGFCAGDLEGGAAGFLAPEM